MKKIFKIFFAFLLGISLLFLVYYYFGLKEALLAFKNLNFLPLFIFLICGVLIDFLLTLRWKLILDANKIKLIFFKVWQYRLSGFALGYLSPQPNIGGDPIKALLLKKDNVNFKKAFSTVLIDRSIQTLTDVFFVFLMLIYLFSFIDLSMKTKIFLFSLVFLPLLTLIFYFNAMKKNKPFLSKFLRLIRFRKFEKSILEIEKNISLFHRKNNSVFIKTIFINVFVWILILIQYSSALILFNIKPSLFSIFVLLVSISFASLVPLPMNLGALELSQITALNFLKLEKSIGLSISLLIRFIDLIRTSIGLYCLFYFGINLKKIIYYIKNGFKFIKNGKRKKSK